MASTSWVVAQSQHALKQQINSHSKQKLKENIQSKDILPRRLHFVRPTKQCNTRPMSSSSSASSSPPKAGRQRSDFAPASIQLFNECDITPLMRWETSTKSRSVGGGLRNLGNSCFMNATLQCLCYNAPFQNYIASKTHKQKCKTNGFCIFCELNKLMPTMLHKQSTAVPQTVFRNLKLLSKKLRPGRQEDAQEFLRFLMEGLQNSCLKQQNRKIKDMRVQETTFIHKLWGGYLRSQIKCCKCGYESNTYDSILDISLEIKGPSVRSAFKHFTDPEILDDDNKYRCSNCNKKRRAIKQFTIFEAPNILVIHLKRFECAPGGVFSGGKINKHVHFDELLDLTEYMSYDLCPKVSYSLIGVLVHYGYSSHGGHYVSYIRAPNDEWYLMDDSRTQNVNINTVLKEKAYLLFYQRNETKVLYQTPTQSPNINVSKRNSSKLSSLDSLQSIADNLPKHSYLFEKKRNTESSPLHTPKRRSSHKKRSQSSSPVLKPLRDRNHIRKNRKSLISNIITDVSHTKQHSTNDAAHEWQQKKEARSGTKRKYSVADDVVNTFSPPKKRKLDNSRSKQLKLLKRRIKKRSVSLSTASCCASSHNAMFIGRKSHTLRLAAKSSLHTSSHHRSNAKRQSMGNIVTTHKWKRTLFHGTLSDNSSESMFSDTDHKTASFCDDSSSSRSPEINEHRVKAMNSILLPVHDGSSPRTLLPIHNTHSHIAPPIHSVKNLKKRIDDENIVREYFADESSRSRMSAIGIANVGVWSTKMDNGENVRNDILNESNRAIVEPKDEWDFMLDTGSAYVKHEKAQHPFKNFERNNYVNKFQSTQTDHDTDGYKIQKSKKKKGILHNKQRFHSRLRRNVIDA